VSDVARVLARMGEAIAIRCYGDPVDWEYGGANELIRNFAYWAEIPVLNMEDDKYHPFQALADVMTVKEKFGTFKGIKFVMSWAYSPSVHKPRAVPQSAIIAASMMGCDTSWPIRPRWSWTPRSLLPAKVRGDERRTSRSATTLWARRRVRTSSIPRPGPRPHLPAARGRERSAKDPGDL
jgi:ornithine carbamoyltransferase